ncbi:MAG: 3-keto-5-aminohexanoate cleavage protein, partial [Kiloniellales bacterium]
IVHVHVREPESGAATGDVALYREVVTRVRDSGSDLLINLTTGYGGRFAPSEDDPRTAGPGTTLIAPEERVRHVEELRPEICSLDVGSFNFGTSVFMNTPAHLRAMATRIKAAGVKPEIEVFEPGHIIFAKQMLEEGLFEEPPMFQLCLGILYASPATAEAMAFLKSLLPEAARWSAFGVSRRQFPMVAEAVEQGGNVRVGLEDNLYLAKGEYASNGQLVEKAVGIMRDLGAEPAEPARAREILGLAPV